MNDWKNTMMKCMEDKSFVTELLQHKTPQAVQAFLASKGIECTEEQVKEFGEMLKEKLAERELSPKDLESVAGGGFIDMIKGWGAEIWDWVESW